MAITAKRLLLHGFYGQSTEERLKKLQGEFRQIFFGPYEPLTGVRVRNKNIGQ